MVALALLGGMWATAARAADHMDSPRTKTYGLLDLNDIYIFQSPTHPGNTVMIATVAPFAGFYSQTLFSPVGDYELKIDNTGDYMEDITYRFTFSMPNRRAVQRVTVERIEGEKSRVVSQGLTGRTIAVAGGGKLAAGLFDDPFFFDENAFFAFKASGNPAAFCNPGHNFFANANTMAIVLEVPSAELVQNKFVSTINMWATTSLNDEQFDREGRPAINTVLIPANLKDAFNSGVPHTDRLLFWDTVIASLKGLGNTPDDTLNLAMLVLPDVNSFDTTNPMGFPNGRRLTDDVIDEEYQLLLKHFGVTTDCVGNDSNFRFAFPYLAVANRYNLK
jgi:hypothetical protein